jgi:hypothetical protein
MPEEAESIRGTDRRDRFPQPVYQALTGAGRGSPQYALDLRESLLDEVELRRVGWEVENLAAPRLDQLLTLSPLWSERLSITTTCPARRLGASNPLDVSLEEDPRGRSFHRQALSHAAPEHRLDDLVPEVFGVHVHPSMMPMGHLPCNPL